MSLQALTNKFSGTLNKSLSYPPTSTLKLMEWGRGCNLDMALDYEPLNSLFLSSFFLYLLHEGTCCGCFSSPFDFQRQNFVDHGAFASARKKKKSRKVLSQT